MEKIDKEKIIQVLDKKIAGLEKQIPIIEERLKNTEFLKKASLEVIEQHKKRLKDYREKINQLKVWRENLSQI